MAKNRSKRKRVAELSFSKRHKSSISQSTNSTRPPPKPQQASQLPPALPFESGDDILLVGEGDFSFANALFSSHANRFRSMTATSFDSEQEVGDKYPQAPAHIRHLRRESVGHAASDDLEDEFEGFSDHDSDSSSKDNPVRVLHSIDATRLDSYRPVRSRAGGYDWIVFQFPHVGGKSTDVNRQVRANQQLLVGFFDKAKGLLHKRTEPTVAQHGQHWREEEDRVHPRRTSDDGRGGRVMVTLFEGEPYTLWNIRDLARHSGYAVERSWRFRWDAFPDYNHARTLGNVKSRAQLEGRVEDEPDRKKGAWRGEDREARSFVFYVNLAGDQPVATMPKKKRKGNMDDSDSE